MKKATALPEKKDWLKGNRPFYFLALLSFLIYLPTLWHGFSPLDERWLFLKQLDIMSDSGNLPLLYKSSITGMYYRPVLMNTFMFDLILGNGAAAFFHFTNMLIHAFCAVLLYRFLLLTGLSKNNSFMAAAIFAVHPFAVHAKCDHPAFFLFIALADLRKGQRQIAFAVNRNLLGDLLRWMVSHPE
jgi:protein O-mannosyl-transferase